MKQVFFLLLWIGIFSNAFAQALLDGDSNLIVTLRGNEILTPNNEVVFNIQGNIIFEGASKKSDQIYYSIDGDFFNQKGKVNAYSKSGKTGKWIVKKEGVYFKSFSSDNLVANIQLTEDYLAFYNAMNDSLVAYISDPQDITAAKAFALFQIVWFRNEMEAQFNEIREAITTVTFTGEGIIGTMEPTFGNGMVWVWDGTFLYPAYNNDAYQVWQFDGSKLQPKVASQTHEEWKWDGDSFAPYWGGHPNNNWTWNGVILRQIWNANYNKEFVYEDNIIGPRFGAFGENEWEVKGEMPKALVTAIVLGVLYR